MPKAIGELIPNLLRETTTKHRALQRLQRCWAKAAGKQLAAHTTLVSLRKGTLTVQTDEPGSSFLLSLEKPRLLQRLRETSGERIDDILVRVGDAG